MSLLHPSRSACGLASAAVLLLASGAAAQGRRLTPEMLWDLGRVADPQVSPDGRFVLYHVRSYDLAANRGGTVIRRQRGPVGSSAITPVTR